MRQTEQVTYQPSGNGSQPLPQTYPRTPSAPPGPSPQLSPMPAPRQAQPVPSPQATTPPPEYYPPAAPFPPAPPAASGPPMLRALQGPLQNPVPILVAAAGLMLVSVAFFLPLASYSYDGSPDPLREMYFLPDRDPDLYLSPERHPALIPLVVAVAITIAMAGSRRWLLFGRLSCYGLSCVGVAAAIGGAYTWQQDMRELIGGSSDFREGMTGEESESGARLLEKTNIGFAAGVWVLVAGIIVLAVAVTLIKARGAEPHAAPPAFGHPQPPRQPTVAPLSPMAPQPYPAAPPPEPADSGDRDIAVHDDPPSLSIYKPPRKDA